MPRLFVFEAAICAQCGRAGRGPHQGRLPLRRSQRCIKDPAPSHRPLQADRLPDSAVPVSRASDFSSCHIHPHNPSPAPPPFRVGCGPKGGGSPPRAEGLRADKRNYHCQCLPLLWRPQGPRLQGPGVSPWMPLTGRGKRGDASHCQKPLAL